MILHSLRLVRQTLLIILIRAQPPLGQDHGVDLCLGRFQGLPRAHAKCVRRRFRLIASIQQIRAHHRLDQDIQETILIAL